MERSPKKQKNNPAEQGASTSTSPCHHYDIFLSFRGPDTRYTFIDHLKRELDGAGYLVFLDDGGIRLGKEIRSELPKAIQESKSSIVVLSQDYASSTWCLNELVIIMDRHTQDEQYYVLPVFYHVDPSDVRNQNNSFANSFAKHQEEAFEGETVKKWKESLAKIGGLSGILVEEKTKESKVIQKIVKQIGESTTGTVKYQFPTSKSVGEGFKRARNEILSLLGKVDVEKIGVYGMGGVGKTTLMTHIYNQLQERSNTFPPSYWVTVSQDFSIDKLQDGVAKAILGGKIREDIAKEDDIKKRAAKLMENLNRKQKFILVLDDLWDDFDTKDVGLPVRPNGCKLVFTTRSYEVCRKMSCKNNSVKIEPLSEGEALYLFRKEIENIEINDEALVKSVIRECAGLPLAIKVMARSMKGVDDIAEWRYTFAQLRDSKFTKDDDMERKVFAVLRLSYVRLKDPSLQQSFLYCALYPEDFEIKRKELIELLICEGIMEGKNRQEEVDKGHFMLNKLENLCLLEGSVRLERVVKMHDLIRDVALQELRQSSVVMVEAGKKLTTLPDVGKWRRDLHRASFINNDILNVPSGHSPHCPDLSTLLLSMNWRLEYIGDSFFEKFNGLQILDLSGTGIKELPSSISNLVRLTGLFLRGCHYLRYVPSLAKLQELKALDLYDTTRIMEAPHGMGLLHNLSYLGLNHWTLVNGEEVGGLRKLEVLICAFQDLSYLQFQKHEKPLISFHLFVNRTSDEKPKYPTDSRVVEIWRCDMRRQFDKFPQGIQELVLNSCKCPKSLVPASNATELMSIKISYCDGIECLVSPSSSYGSMFIHLKKLFVFRCHLHGMKTLFPPGLLQNLKNLECLDILDCRGIEGIISSEESGSSSSGNITSQFSLPKLRRLRLHELPQLTSICDGLLICEKLKNIELGRCEMLKRIPIAPPLQFLRKGSFGSIELLEQFKRDHPGAKDILQYIPYDYSSSSDDELDSHGVAISETQRFTGSASLLFHQLLPGSIFKKLVLFECHQMKTVFPQGLLQNVKNLEYLEVEKCRVVEEIIASSKESGSSYIASELSLPKLRTLKLRYLARLTSICDGSLICRCLQEIEVFECPMLERIPIAPPLLSLQPGLPELRALTLYNLPRLTSICDGPMTCNSLQEFTLGRCEMLKKIPIIPPLSPLRRGVLDSKELLEQFEREHPIAEGILRHVESRELFNPGSWNCSDDHSSSEDDECSDDCSSSEEDELNSD